MEAVCHERDMVSAAWIRALWAGRAVNADGIPLWKRIGLTADVKHQLCTERCARVFGAQRSDHAAKGDRHRYYYIRRDPDWRRRYTMMYFGLILCMTFMGAVASVFFKRASGSDGFLKLLMNVNLYIGGFLYVAAAAINIVVLRYLDYSVVLPLSSVTYIWTMVLSYVILQETITKKKILGVACIVLGAVCVAV